MVRTLWGLIVTNGPSAYKHNEKLLCPIPFDVVMIPNISDKYRYNDSTFAESDWHAIEYK